MRNASWILVMTLASATALAQEKTIEPGLYEVVTKTNMGPATTAKTCLNAKDVASGLNPPMDKDCKRTRSVVAGGKLDFAMTCTDMTATSTGTYTPTSYAIDGKVTIKGDDPMTIESHITAKRIADRC